MSAQRALPFKLRERSTFQDFVVGANGELVDRLRRVHDGFECLWLLGAPGVGKTHLLQALCHEHRNSVYIPARSIGADGESLAGYADFGMTAADDVGWWCGTAAAELAVIGLYDRLTSRGARLVIAADRSPMDMTFALPDLRSRARAAACYRVAPLDDAGCAELLTAAARQRGLALSSEAVRFLLARVTRDQRELLRILDRLDHSSLAAHRRITIPFIKEVLCL